MSPPPLRIRSLVRGFGERVVLDGIDLEVSAGERVALVGPNGAGKTTLFRCVLGILAFGGSVEVAGRGVPAEGKAARARTGYVPQKPPVHDLSLGRFLELMTDLREVPLPLVAGRLESLGLPLADARDRHLRELSGGMLQKAVLALALASGAPLLLLDEPTASLDPGSRREFLRAVRDVREGRTLLFASHRFDEIASLADRVVVLHRGRIVFDDSPAELRRASGLEADLSRPMAPAPDEMMDRLLAAVGREDSR